MYALVELKLITKIFNNPKGFTLGDIQYSKDIFTKWSTEEKKAIGIYEIIFNDTNKKDETWYINTNQTFTFSNDTVTASYGTATAKAHADSLFTAKDKTDSLIPDDKSVGDVKVKGLKTILIKTLKQQVSGILNNTDWYITRKVEKTTAIPSAITTHRDLVRSRQATMETQITNANNTLALKTLYTYTTTNGVQSRPLGELPTLEI